MGAPPAGKPERPLSRAEGQWLADSGIDGALDRMLRDMRVFTRGGSLRAERRGSGYACELTLPGTPPPTPRLVRIRDFTLAACDQLDKAVEHSLAANRARAARLVVEAHVPATRARALLDSAVGG